MRRCAVCLGVVAVFALAFPASPIFAQTSGSGPGFFGAVAKPSFNPIATKPVFPAPLSIGRFFSSFPNFRDLMLMRNVSSPPPIIVMPQPTPPPSKK